MNRIDNNIRNPEYYYDEFAVEGWIKFCENEMTLVDGKLKAVINEGQMHILHSFISGKCFRLLMLKMNYIREKEKMKMD